MADIEKWITVNGVHIPIMKGESKAKAVGRFLQRRKSGKLAEKHIERGEQYSQRHDAEEADKYMKEKYGKNWDKYSNKDIKGRARTKEEKLDNLEDNAMYYEVMKDDAKASGDRNLYNFYKNKFNKYDRQYESEKARPTAKYKLKADNYKLSKAEEKLQDFAQTSKSEYNISNIKAKELPSGAIHITTKSGKDISTINPKALTAAEKNALRKKGILK